MNRREFLKSLMAGATVGAAGLALPQLIVEPRRKLWAVPRSAPVDARIVGEDVDLVAGLARLRFQRPNGELLVIAVTDEALEERWGGRWDWAHGLEPDILRPLREWADTLPAAERYREQYVAKLPPLSAELRRAYLQGDWYYASDGV